MVDGDGDQALAAEPGFHSTAPSGTHAALIYRLLLIDPVICVDAYPLKNGQPLALGVMGVRLVMLCLAGGVLMKHSPWLAV